MSVGLSLAKCIVFDYHKYLVDFAIDLIVFYSISRSRRADRTHFLLRSMVEVAITD